MPTSDHENKDTVARWYKQLKPRSVLDIGAGEGTYSQLIDDKLGARWTALEAWSPYLEQYSLRQQYDDVIVADARYVDYSLIKPELVIAGDVLEHMEKADAKRCIDRFKQHASHIIISIPLLHLHQDAFEGNWFEIHKDHWDYDEMCGYLGEGLRDSVAGPTLGYFLWSK